MWKQQMSNDKKFESAPPGTYGAVCTRVIDLGTQPVQWEGETKHQRKVSIQWELDENMPDGRPFVINRKFTVSMHEKAALRIFLKGWRGRDFTNQFDGVESVQFVIGEVTPPPAFEENPQSGLFVHGNSELPIYDERTAIRHVLVQLPLNRDLPLMLGFAFPLDGLCTQVDHPSTDRAIRSWRGGLEFLVIAHLLFPHISSPK